MAKFIEVIEDTQSAAVINIANIALMKESNEANSPFRDIVLNVNMNGEALSLKTIHDIGFLKHRINNAIEDYVPLSDDEERRYGTSNSA